MEVPAAVEVLGASTTQATLQQQGQEETVEEPAAVEDLHALEEAVEEEAALEDLDALEEAVEAHLHHEDPSDGAPR